MLVSILLQMSDWHRWVGAWSLGVILINLGCEHRTDWHPIYLWIPKLVRVPAFQNIQYFITGNLEEASCDFKS